jgi:hypothetical protein
MARASISRIGQLSVQTHWEAFLDDFHHQAAERGVGLIQAYDLEPTQTRKDTLHVELYCVKVVGPVLIEIPTDARITTQHHEKVGEYELIELGNSNHGLRLHLLFGRSGQGGQVIVGHSTVCVRTRHHLDAAGEPKGHKQYIYELNVYEVPEQTKPLFRLNAPLRTEDPNYLRNRDDAFLRGLPDAQDGVCDWATRSHDWNPSFRSGRGQPASVRGINQHFAFSPMDQDGNGPSSSAWGGYYFGEEQSEEKFNPLPKLTLAEAPTTS